MFYPCLNNLKKAKFPKQSIDLLDWWLGTRRQNTIKNINPLQFSLDCNINIEHTLKLFSYCTFSPDISLFKRKYVIYCPVCDHRIITYYAGTEKCSEYRCQNCSTVVTESILPRQTELLFELTMSPQYLDDMYEEDRVVVGASSKKANGLRVVDIQEHSNEEIRRLNIFDVL